MEQGDVMNAPDGTMTRRRRAHIKITIIIHDEMDDELS
jgi:hypothetical protein